MTTNWIDEYEAAEVRWLILEEQHPRRVQPQPEKEPKMKVSQMIESKYLKTGDLKDGEEVCTIKSLKRVNVARDDEEAEYKWTAKFAEHEKPMVLNKTNIKRLEKALGDDTDDWIDKTVVVYVDDNIQFGSDVVSGLRIRAVRKTVTVNRRDDDDFSDPLA